MDTVPFPRRFSAIPPSSPQTHRKQLLPGILGLVEQLYPPQLLPPLPSGSALELTGSSLTPPLGELPLGQG